MRSPIAAMMAHMADMKKGKPSSSSVVIEASSKPKVISDDAYGMDEDNGSADKYAEKVFEAIKDDDLDSFKRALRGYMDACEAEEAPEAPEAPEEG